MRLLLAAAVLLPTLANAQMPEPARTVSYFMAHPGEMRQVMAACVEDHRYNHDICANARGAANGLRADASFVDFGAMLADPRYYLANPIARDVTIQQCRAGKNPHRDACQAAAQAALQLRQ